MEEEATRGVYGRCWKRAEGDDDVTRMTAGGGGVDEGLQRWKVEAENGTGKAGQAAPHHFALALTSLIES